MWYNQSHCFRRTQTQHTQRELENWVSSFAKNFLFDEEWINRTIRAANKILQESFCDENVNQLCLEVSANPSESVRRSAVFPQEQNIFRERREFNRALDTYNLKYMKTGESGPIRFHLVSYDSEEMVPRIVFDELERAIVLNSSNGQRFRRCFTLANDFSLNESFTISVSPIEERQLLTNCEKFQANSMSAIVSLLSSNYGATAFRVAPQGIFLTCHRNLYFQDGASEQETIYLHNEVASYSYSFVKKTNKLLIFNHVTYRHFQLLPQTLCMDQTSPSSVYYDHADVATISSDLPGYFLIPDPTELSPKLPVVCVGYPRKIELKRMKDAYSDLPVPQLPALEDYSEIFQAGILSVSPGPVCGYNNHVVAAEVSTAPGFSGAPICRMDNPRVRKGKNYALSVSVRDPAFYKLYSQTVVPALRNAALSQEDKTLINKYLSACGSTPPLE